MTDEPRRPPPSDDLGQGLVVRKLRGHYAVRTDDGETIDCAISSKLRKKLIYPTADASSRHRSVDKVAGIRKIDPVAVGDQVRFVDAGPGLGMIVEVLPRRNVLSRVAAGHKPIEQVVAANIDQIVIVFAAAQPEPKWNLLDRYLVEAEASGIPPRVCMTKMDLVDERAISEEIEVYRRLEYPILLTSAVTGRGISDLVDSLAGRVSLLMGKSGVGKSTLLNAIEPGLGLRVNAVAAKTGKGKHTTSHLEMFDLAAGGSVIDTPGMREFGLWHVAKSDLAELFRDLQPYLGQCRFGADCSHSHEPGCAIKEAVAAGDIPERRYRSYLRMATE